MIFTRGSRSSNALTILSTGYATLQPNAGQTARHRGQEKAPNAPQHKVQTTATKGTPLAKTLVTYFQRNGYHKGRCHSLGSRGGRRSVRHCACQSIHKRRPRLARQTEPQHTRGSRPLLPSCHNLQGRVHRRLRHHLFGISHLVVRGTGDCQHIPRVLRPDWQNNRPVCHLGRKRNGQDGVDP